MPKPLCTNLLLRLSEVADSNPAVAHALGEGDFHAAVNNAQTHYATSGNDDLGEVLVNLLAEQAGHPSQDYLRKIMAQAVDIAPVLTDEQWNSLSVLFVVREILPSLPTIHSAKDVAEFLNTILRPFVESSICRSTGGFRTIFHTGCAIPTDGQSLAMTLIAKLPWVFAGPVRLLDLLSIDGRARALIDSTIHDRDHLVFSRKAYEDLTGVARELGISFEGTSRIRTLMKASLKSEKDCREAMTREIRDFYQFEDLWSNSPLSTTTLTAVGMAIGHANLRRRNFSFEIERHL